MCAALAKERSVQKRVHNAESVESLNPSNYARHDRVKTAVLISRLKGSAAKIKLLFYSDRNTKAALAVAEKRVERMELKMKTVIHHDNAPKYMKYFLQAVTFDVLPPETMQILLEDMGKGLLKHSHTRGATVKRLYVTLLNNGSPWIASLVARNLGGPHIDTIKRWRGSEAFNYEPGLLVENMKQLVLMLKLFDLMDVPGYWSEDATTCLKRLTVSLDYGPGDAAVWVEGFLEPLRVVCLADLTAAFEKYDTGGLATYVYVWKWVPQVEQA
jgi:hypothetical protein